MKIKLTKNLLDSINDGNMERFGIEMEDLHYGIKEIGIRVDDWSISLLEDLRDMVLKSKVFGAKVTAADLTSWIETVKEEQNMPSDNYINMKARKTEFFATFLTKYLVAKGYPHRIYQNDPDRGIMYCCYVYNIEYHEQQKDHRSNVTPEYVEVNLAWKEFGQNHKEQINFYQNECAHFIKVKDALASKGLYVPSKSLDREYAESVKKFEAIAWNVGEQYLATGGGSTDVESEGRSTRQGSRWSWYKNIISLDKDGEPSRVVIDLFDESEEQSSRSNRNEYVDTSWWSRFSPEDMTADKAVEELPIHPNLVIFALNKHTRLRVHVNQLEKYVYDKSMADKLILPAESSSLVKTLINYKGGFQDIVKNKGGGAIVLCVGEPGTGKTLTAEVYSESMEKPLYSIQCSQLGTDPDELEKYLLNAFERAERWNAVLLLDEADVYTRSRGDDIQQNAIVGVFLRLMEYYRGVMFMTTNRNDTDDAIASRCIARIIYNKPPKADAKKIWRILADVMGLDLRNNVINQLVDRYNNLSGRDIKNLLKLVKLIQDPLKPKPVTLETIEFVKQFKPTN